MTELEPGHVIRFGPGAGGVDPGVYVILSDPTAPVVMVCLAGEDETTGDVCETEVVVLVDRETLDTAERLNMPPLPWPRPRVWATD